MLAQIKTLIIDNYDSFTNNFFQYIYAINKTKPILIKNDQYSLEEILKFKFDNIIISPGPGRPELAKDFGLCAELIKIADVPILGVCLGHQGIANVFGAEIMHAPHPVHGQVDLIRHNNSILFTGIPEEFVAVRYHSLVVNSQTVPKCLEVIAYAKNNLIMALKHKQKPIWGVQFHPESICTDFGFKLLENFMDVTKCHIKSFPKQPRENFELIGDLFSSSSELFRKTTADKTCCVDSVHDSSYAGAHTSVSGVHYSCVSLSAVSRKRVLFSKLNRKKLKLNFRKLNFLYKDYKLCEYLHTNISDFVWLDSNGEQSSVSRFAIFAYLDGPHGYKVSYDVNKQVITYQKNKRQRQFSVSIFDFMKLQLEKIAFESIDLPFNFKCGFIGYFGYELYKDTLNIKSNKISEHPDAQFLFVDRAIVFDKLAKTTYLLALHNDNTEKLAVQWFEKMIYIFEETKLTQSKKNLNLQYAQNNVVNLKLMRSKENYLKDIDKCLEFIRNGESYEVCLTNKAIYDKPIDALSYYLSLRELSKTPFSAFIKFGSLAVCCSSMERFLAIDKDRNIESKPIKGTLPRGKTQADDVILREKLRNSIKYKSENLMIVDLLRHDLGGVSEIGSVKVEKLMAVETYAAVHQLVSTISAKLRADLSPIDCIKAAFPGGSMVGAPKKRTIELINTLEKTPRGIYSGAIGYISLDGCVDLNIVIRTAVITPETFSVGVGGAIIALSDPKEEFDEIMVKLDLLKKALNQVA